MIPLILLIGTICDLCTLGYRSNLSCAWHQLPPEKKERHRPAKELRERCEFIADRRDTFAICQSLFWSTVFFVARLIYILYDTGWRQHSSQLAPSQFSHNLHKNTYKGKKSHGNTFMYALSMLFGIYFYRANFIQEFLGDLCNHSHWLMAFFDQ